MSCIYSCSQTQTPDYYERIVSRIFSLVFSSCLRYCSAKIGILFCLVSPVVDDLHPAVHHEAQSEVICVHWRVRQPQIYITCTLIPATTNSPFS